MNNAALQSLLTFAGWPKSRVRDVEFIGTLDPILPTSFKITETASATLAAVGLAVADLWELRTGRRQSFSIASCATSSASASSPRMRQACRSTPGIRPRRPLHGREHSDCLCFGLSRQGGPPDPGRHHRPRTRFPLPAQDFPVPGAKFPDTCFRIPC